MLDLHRSRQNKKVCEKKMDSNDESKMEIDEEFDSSCDRAFIWNESDLPSFIWNESINALG